MEFLKKEFHLFVNILLFFVGKRKYWYKGKNGKFLTSPRRFYRGIADINGIKVPFVSSYFL